MQTLDASGGGCSSRRCTPNRSLCNLRASAQQQQSSLGSAKKAVAAAAQTATVNVTQSPAGEDRSSAAANSPPAITHIRFQSDQAGSIEAGNGAQWTTTDSGATWK